MGRFTQPNPSEAERLPPIPAEPGAPEDDYDTPSPLPSEDRLAYRVGSTILTISIVAIVLWKWVWPLLSGR